jgi:hypothetical protein
LLKSSVRYKSRRPMPLTSGTKTWPLRNSIRPERLPFLPKSRFSHQPAIRCRHAAPEGKPTLCCDKIFSVDVGVNGDKPEFSAPKQLMTVPQDVEILSIMPAGKRMLATRLVGQGGTSPMELMLNWQHLVQ